MPAMSHISKRTKGLKVSQLRSRMLHLEPSVISENKTTILPFSIPNLEIVSPSRSIPFQSLNLPPPLSPSSNSSYMSILSHITDNSSPLLLSPALNQSKFLRLSSHRPGCSEIISRLAGHSAMAYSFIRYIDI